MKIRPTTSWVNRWYTSKSNDWYVARLAQSVERKALNLVVVGSSPTVGGSFLAVFCASSHLAVSLGELTLECTGHDGVVYRLNNGLIVMYFL